MSVSLSCPEALRHGLLDACHETSMQNFNECQKESYRMIATSDRNSVNARRHRRLLGQTRSTRYIQHPRTCRRPRHCRARVFASPPRTSETVPRYLEYGEHSRGELRALSPRIHLSAAQRTPMCTCTSIFTVSCPLSDATSSFLSFPWQFLSSIETQNYNQNFLESFLNLLFVE